MWHRIGKGGRRYWGKRAAGFVLTDGSSVLLLKRSEKGDMAGHWSIPGGKVEEGETFLGGAQRENREETGQMPNCTRLGTFDHQDGRFVFKTFLCKIDKPYEARLSDEHTESRWVPIRQVDQMRIHPGLRAVWPSVLRTINEKIGEKDDLQDKEIHKEMSSNRFHSWEMQRVLSESWLKPIGQSGSPQPKRFGVGQFSPELMRFAQQVADELEMPMTDKAAEKALLNILARATPEPVGWPEGGMLRVDWFETVIDAIAKDHLQKNNGRFREHEPAIRQSRTPMQLLRTLRNFMPNDNFNPNVSMEGATGSSNEEQYGQFKMRSSGYDIFRNIPHQASPSAASSAVSATPPSTPTATPPPSAPQATPQAGSAKGKKAATVPMTPASNAQLDDILAKMPKEVFMNGRRPKSDADIMYIVQSIVFNFHLTGVAFTTEDLKEFKKHLGFN